jgi:hypothetical protein
LSFLSSEFVSRSLRVFARDSLHHSDLPSLRFRHNLSVGILSPLNAAIIGACDRVR